MTPTVRARLLGAILLLAMFGAGVAADHLWLRTEAGGVNVNVRMSTELPPELRRLNLAPAQQDTIRRILRDGRRQTLDLLHGFEPRLRQTVDSINAAIHAALTPAQRAELDASTGRRSPGGEQRAVDTTRR